MEDHGIGEAPEEGLSGSEPPGGSEPGALEGPPGESEPGALEGPPGESEPGASGGPPGESEPEAPKEADEQGASADPSGQEPEAPPPGESGSVDGEKVQDLIDAIGDLNETITGAVTEEPEQLPAEGAGDGSGGGGGGESTVVEPASVDLTPVVRVLERTNELLVQQTEILATQHNDLLQLQANVDLVFLAVCMLAGVIIGCAVGKVFHDLWRS